MGRGRDKKMGENLPTVENILPAVKMDEAYVTHPLTIIGVHVSRGTQMGIGD